VSHIFTVKIWVFNLPLERERELDKFVDLTLLH